MKLILVALCALICCALAALPAGAPDAHCVHVVDEEFFTLEHAGDDMLVITPTKQYLVPPCQKKMSLTHGPAWKAWAQYENASAITNLYGKWAVPAAPTVASDSQTLFWWNGVEPGDNSAVLQPVLQWGTSAAGGGNYWAIASWYVSDAHTIVSKLTTVNTGDVIEGTNTYSSSAKSWTITAAVSAKNISTTIHYKGNTDIFLYAYEVLEAYGIIKCTDYPAAGVVSFTDIQVQAGGVTVEPTWSPEIQQPITCKEVCTIISPSQVDIHF